MGELVEGCCVPLQLHASGRSEAGCDAEGRLQMRQEDLVSIFITSTAEMPGMLFASLLVDFVGRKRSLPKPDTLAFFGLICPAWLGSTKGDRSTCVVSHLYHHPCD